MQIIITGATKGIGRALLEIWAKENQHTFFLCARNKEDLQAVKNDIALAYPGNEVYIHVCDVANKNEVLAFAAWITSFEKPIDVLINNAGLFVPGSLHNEPEGTAELMLQTNFFSAYHLTRALMPLFLAQKKGTIVNMCSIASIQAYSNGGSYSVSKFALAGFTKNLREEMKPLGIRVIGVYPGATMTHSWNGINVEENRLISADDVAVMVHAAVVTSERAVVEDIVIRPQLGDL